MRDAVAAYLRTGRDQYRLLCLVALGMVFLLDLSRDFALMSLLLLTVGVLGVISRLRISIILFLGVVAWSPLLRQFGSQRLGLPGQTPRPDVQLGDMAFSLAILAYVIAQCRLQSLTLHILPPDPRRRSGPGRWPFAGPMVTVRRPDNQVSRNEIGWFLLALPVWGLLGILCWYLIAGPRELAGMPSAFSRLVLAAWSLGMGVILLSTALRFWEWRQLLPELALLYLQEVLWQESRRDQRRLNRWLTWKWFRKGTTHEVLDT